MKSVAEQEAIVRGAEMFRCSSDSCLGVWHPSECRTCEELDDEGQVRGVVLDDGTCPECERTYDPRICHRCRSEGKPRKFADFFEGGARQIPSLPADLVPIYHSYFSIGRSDERPLRSEMNDCLDEEGVTDRELRRVIKRWWFAIADIEAVEAARRRRLSSGGGDEA